MKKSRIKPRSSVSFGTAPHDPNCLCVFCKRKQPFSVPSELIDDLLDGDVVLFVGAGVSTEADGLLHDNFYERMSYVVGNTDLRRSFPDVMEEVCRSPSGRPALIEHIRDHFDYIYGHGDLYREATRFHRALATFFPIDTIVTTNWDTYFEDECGATPFVTDKDIALWNAAQRKVLKIHGTISNMGSIVATRSDYKSCALRLNRGILGAHLKSLLSTKTTIFIGYSLRDDDFLQIYTAIRRYLSEFHRQSYFVSPAISSDEQVRLEAMNVHLIKTDGEYFISQLKEHARSKGIMHSDEMYSNVAGLLEAVREGHVWLHDAFSMVSYPQLLYSSWYQDGLIHSLERIARLRFTGLYSQPQRLVDTAGSYERFAYFYRRDRNYSDAAYCLGYANGYFYASASVEDQERIFPPLFFYFGRDIFNKTQLKRELKRLPDLHKRAYNYAKSLTRKYGDEIVLDHKAQLNLAKYLDENAVGPT